MEQIILLALQAIEALLPKLLNSTSGTQSADPGVVQKLIAMLEQAIPVAIQFGEDMVTPVENIIAQLEGSGAVTADQIAALKAMMAADEADLDAAAKDDDLV